MERKKLLFLKKRADKNCFSYSKTSLTLKLISHINSSLLSIKTSEEAVTQTCSVKKVFFKISQNSQENACGRVPFLIKMQAAPATLLKKRLWHKRFPVNFAKFLRTPFFTEHLSTTASKSILSLTAISLC